MQTNTGSWKLAEDNLQSIDPMSPTCGGCGKTYQRPITATVSSRGNVQTYQACPHCMTKVPAVVAPRNVEIKTATRPRKTQSPEKITPTAPSSVAPSPEGKCEHFFGYLNKRTKGTPVPEHCLTCEKMVDCMYG